MSERFVFRGICQGCNKETDLHYVGHLEICSECEDKFFEDMFKQLEDSEYGRDYVLNERLKKET